MHIYYKIILIFYYICICHDLARSKSCDAYINSHDMMPLYVYLEIYMYISSGFFFFPFPLLIRRYFNILVMTLGRMWYLNRVKTRKSLKVRCKWPESLVIDIPWESIFAPISRPPVAISQYYTSISIFNIILNIQYNSSSLWSNGGALKFKL